MKTKMFFLLIIVAGLFLTSCMATQMVPVYDANGRQVGYTEQRRPITISVYGGYQSPRPVYRPMVVQQPRPMYQPQPVYYPQQPRPMYQQQPRPQPRYW